MKKDHDFNRLGGFESLLNEAQIIVISYDKKGNATYVSPGTKNIIGFSEKDLLNDNWWKLTCISAEDEKSFKHKVIETISGKIEVNSHPYDREVHCKNGSTKWIEWRDSFVHNEFISVGVDITEWKKEEELEKQSGLILKHIESMLIVTDVKGNVLYVNPAVEKTMGYTTEEVFAGTWWERAFDDPLEILEVKKEIFDNVFFQLKDFKNIIKRKTKTADGQYKWIEWQISKGIEETYIFVGNDISNRILTELELKKRKEFAEESVKVKNEFLANMSHEIRTPLNAILGFMDLLMESELNSVQMNHLRTMRSSGQILLSLINTVLDLSKLESDKIDLEEIAFNLPDQLKKIVKLMQVTASEKKIELELNIEANTPDTIMGDPTRLNQILLNLISNAIKFTNEGCVTILVRLIEENADTCKVYFEVTDTGIGILSNKINTVFGAFTQAKSNTSRIYGGTGLGLTIVKRLVILMNGIIRVKSKFGEGSVFEVTIPFKKGVGKIETKTEVQVVSSDQKLDLNILLVEDNKVNQLLAKTRLERWGCKVDIANNGIEGVKRVQRGSYDIILMDIQMPIMDGYEAAKIIKNDISDEAGKIPILAMTAYSSKEDITRALNAGMSDHILKPFDPNRFYRLLKKYGNISKSIEEELYPVSSENADNKNNNQYINLEFIDEETMQENDIKKLLLEQFVKDIDGFIKLVDIGMEEGDWDLLHRATHKIKPSVSMFGISKLEPIIHRLVNRLKKEEDFEHAQDQLKTCTEIFGHAKKELLTELKSLDNES